MRKGKRTFASRKRKIAGLSAFVLAGVIGVGAYAFTAGNTFAEVSGAGDGAETVSGYEISPLHFTLNGEAEATKAEFTATPATGEAAATEAKLSLYEAGKTPTVWTKCTEATGKWVCTFATPLSPAEIKLDTEEQVVATS
jgi:hypothetical protein